MQWDIMSLVCIAGYFLNDSFKVPKSVSAYSWLWIPGWNYLKLPRPPFNGDYQHKIMIVKVWFIRKIDWYKRFIYTKKWSEHLDCNDFLINMYTDMLWCNIIKINQFTLKIPNQNYFQSKLLALCRFFKPVVPCLNVKHQESIIQKLTNIMSDTL